MHLRLPVVLLSAFALASPGAMAHGKDKNKDKKEHKSDDQRGDRHDDDDDGDERDHRNHRDDGRRGKITICHIPPGNRSARHTISVSESAWQAHQGHGDHRGACGRGGTSQGRRFSELDTNHDGVLSFSEFHGERAAFDRLDRNHNGSISREEFSRR